MKKLLLSATVLLTGLGALGPVANSFAQETTTSEETSSQAEETVWHPYYGWAEIVDEFEGDSINTQMWNVLDETWLDYDWGWISAKNVEVKDGTLRLSTVRNQADVTEEDGRHRTWGSARVEQNYDYAREFGYWEFRAKMPVTGKETQGFWPALWLYNTDWKGGEMDLVETYGADTPESQEPSFKTEGKASVTSHFNPDSEGQRKHVWINIDNDWHTYGAEKSPEGLRYYVDGHLVLTIPSDAPGYEESFAPGTTMFAIMSAQTGNNYWGQMNDQTADVLTMEVDYYRYWNLDDLQGERPQEMTLVPVITLPQAE